MDNFGKKLQQVTLWVATFVLLGIYLAVLLMNQYDVMSRIITGSIVAFCVLVASAILYSIGEIIDVQHSILNILIESKYDEDQTLLDDSQYND